MSKYTSRMDVAATLELLVRGTSMTQEQAADLMQQIMTGELHDAQIAGVLIALRVKGVNADELAGFAQVMKQNATVFENDVPNLVDTCGTGGGPPTFNLSTTAAIIAAAAGAKVAKHGNRAVTSKCGSADVLEELGVELTGDMEQLQAKFAATGIVFLFAPNHHPAMRFVGPVRKALGVRTVFNQLGPLANPANASCQLVGVYDRSLIAPMAEALKILGLRKAMVVCSKEGMDEISPCGKTYGCLLENGAVSEMVLTPESFGLDAIPFEALAPGETLAEAALAVRQALTEHGSMRARAALPNAGAALYLAGVANTLKEGASLASKAIETGAAAAALDGLIS